MGIRKARPFYFVPVTTAILTLLTATAIAQTTTSWKPNKDGTYNFDDAGNWTGGVPGNLDTAVFDKGNTITVDLTAGIETTNANLELERGNLTLNINGSATSPSSC